MTVTVVTPPAALPLTLEEAKLHLRVDEAHDDALILDLIDAATREIDGPAGWLGRALITQTLALSLDAFPSGRTITLPYPPIQSVSHVKYRDADDVEQTLDAALYVVDTKSEPGRLGLLVGEAWPTTARVPNAVVVTYVAGYGATGVFVPADIKAYLKLQIGRLYAVREPVIVGTNVATLPGHVHMLNKYRLGWVV